MRRLIVNADDFGLTRGVNRAIAELHEQRKLTSTTVMTRAFATEDAIARSRMVPSLGIGCHVVLVDGEPVLPPSEIPTLTDPETGRFHPTSAGFLRRALTGSIRTGKILGQIEAEAGAQIRLLQQNGLRLTHIDTHKHTHMFPAVLRPVLRAARSAGIAAVRNPFEPAWSRRATAHAPLVRRIEVSLLQRLEPAFRRIVAEHGFRTTEGAIGVLATGTLDATTLRSLLKSVPPGTWELVTHPGYNDADLARVHTRLKESRETELEALQLIGEIAGLELIGFAQLPAAATSEPVKIHTK